MLKNRKINPNRNYYIFNLLVSFVFFLCVAGFMLNSRKTIFSAIQIGTSEHHELIKSSIWAKDPGLIDKLWNDQPLLHTVILGFAFRHFGNDVGTARGVALVFTLILLVAIFFTTYRHLGATAGCLSVFAVFAAPHIFQLSISAMLEVPSFAIAMVSLMMLEIWFRKGKVIWLIASAISFAVSLNIKWTSAIVGPALLCELFIMARDREKVGLTGSVPKILITWVIVVFFLFLVLTFIIGPKLDSTLESHFSDGTRNNYITKIFSLWSVIGFTDLIEGHPESLLIVCLGIWVALIPGGFRLVAFPLTWLISALVIHSVNRPFWYYYYLHLAIPIGLIASVSISKFIDGSQNSQMSRCVRLTNIIKRSLAIITFSFTISIGIFRLSTSIASLQEIPVIENVDLIKVMRQYAPYTNWIYTRSTIFAFHAGMVPPPEIAILPTKRFWSGQIDDDGIIKVVERYQPEALLLKIDYDETIVYESSLRDKYRMIYTDKTYQFWMANRVL